MKKIILTFLISISWLTSSAQNHAVSISEAEMAASSWIQKHFPKSPIVSITIDAIRDERGNTLLYEVKTDSISLLLSASKSAIPIVSWSHTDGHSLIEEYKQNILPCGLRSIMDYYIAQLKMCYLNDDKQLYYDDEWAGLLSRETVEAPLRITEVGPLLKTIWGQSCSNNYYPIENVGDPYAYNYFIPAGATCSHCPVGCGAVAMGQVMYYWHTPLLLKGLPKQFDWCNMTPKLLSDTSTYETNRNAIAYFLWQCAERINTSYSCGESNSNLTDTRDALVDFFQYSEDAHYSEKRFYTDTEWITKLKNHINWGFPVIYRGTGAGGGHAFVCDGYDNNELFRFNWGWTDESLNAHYFSLQHLTPRDTNDYTQDQAAIFYIHPEEETSLCDITLDLGDFYSFNPLLIFAFYQPYEIIPQTTTKLISASASTSVLWRTIPDGATAIYQAHEEIELRDGFTVERGAEFTAEIVPCPNCENSRETNAGTEEVQEDIAAPPQEVAKGPADPASEVATAETVLYPNPTTGEATVGVSGEVQSIIVYNALGRPVGGWHLRSLTPDHVTLDLRPLPAGTYMVRVLTADGATTQRIVVTR